MAFLPNIEQKDNEKMKLLGPQTSSESSFVTPTTNTSPLAPKTAPQGSGMFTDIKKYLDANKGAGEQFAPIVEKKAGSDVEKVRQGIEQSKQNLMGGIAADKNTAESNKQQAMNVLEGIQSASYDNGLNYQPTSEQQNLFQNLYNYTPEKYIAPSFGSNIAGLKSAQMTPDLLKTPEGRFSLIRQAVNNPTYTRGQNVLDQMLLEQSPSAISNIQRNVGEQAKNVGNLIPTYQNELANQYQTDVQGTTLSAQEAIKNALESNFSNLETSAAERAKNETDINKVTLDALKNKLATGQDINYELSQFVNNKELRDNILNDYQSLQHKMSSNPKQFRTDYKPEYYTIGEASQAGLLDLGGTFIGDLNAPSTIVKNYKEVQNEVPFKQPTYEELNLGSIDGTYNPVTAEQTITPEEYAKYQALLNLGGTGLNRDNLIKQKLDLGNTGTIDANSLYSMITNALQKFNPQQYTPGIIG